MSATKSRGYERGAWGTAAWIDERWCRIRLKNPLGALMVNTIAYREQGTLLVIDPGWPWTLKALSESLRDLGLVPTASLEHVTHFLYTHTHIDHMGGAALLSSRYGASHHYFEGIGRARLERWHAFQDELADWDAWQLSVLAGERRLERQREIEQRGPKPTMVGTYGEGRVERAVAFKLGEELRFGSLRFEVHDASGHDPYHVALLDPDEGTLVSGDAILPMPTPITGVMGDDLGLYEATLKRLARLDAERMIPGHGTQVIGREAIAASIERSAGYVASYREGTLRALKARRGELVDLWSVAWEMRPDEEMKTRGVQWMAHVGLVQARLDRMVALGQVERVDDGSGPRYLLT